MLGCSRFAQRYPWPVVVFSFLLFLVSLAGAASFLEFQTDREDQRRATRDPAALP
jgi:hypothetical protein